MKASVNFVWPVAGICETLVGRVFTACDARLPTRLTTLILGSGHFCLLTKAPSNSNKGAGRLRRSTASDAPPALPPVPYLEQSFFSDATPRASAVT